MTQINRHSGIDRVDSGQGVDRFGSRECLGWQSHLRFQSRAALAATLSRLTGALSSRHPAMTPRRPAPRWKICAYDRRWALTLLDQTMTRLRQEFETSEKEAEFEALKIFLTTEKCAINHGQITKTTGVTEPRAWRFTDCAAAFAKFSKRK